MSKVYGTNSFIVRVGGQSLAERELGWDRKTIRKGIRFAPHTIVINLDNCPENSSCRSQFIKRIVDFAQGKKTDVSLLYYSPYHSQYNPIERVWGVLENHWNGELLESVEKVLGLAGTMEWKGKNPVLTMVEGIYETGMRLKKDWMYKQ